MSPINQNPATGTDAPGVWPPPPTDGWSSPVETSPLAVLEQFRVQNVWLVGFLAIITLGVYASFWLKRQVVTINALRPDLKLSLGTANVVLVVGFLSAGLDLVDMFTSVHLIDTLSNGLDRVWELMMLFLVFQVRGALNTMLQARKGDAYWFSGLWTFLFSIIYLQHKINKSIQHWRSEPARATC